MTRTRLSAAAGALLLIGSLAVADASAAAPKFNAYPSYSAKFDLASEKFSLVTSMVLYNISGKTFSDVSFEQKYPEGVRVKETYQREIGTAETGEQSSDRTVKENVFYANMEAYKNGQYVVIFNELDLARRLDEITFPGTVITYTDGEGSRITEKLSDNTYNLFIYSNVVGGLQRFLSKYNKITFDFLKAIPNRTEWEFAPIAASAQGRFPTGIIGTFPGQDQYNGHFRLRSGPPGDNVQVLVVYKAVDEKNKISTREAVLDRVGRYLKWCGEFEIMDEGLEVTQGKWKKYKDAWHVQGRWKDTIRNRLGEGVLSARVFFGKREDVEYYVLGLGHGRGLGAEASAAPKPEKEAELAAQVEALLDTFKSSIVPLSRDRR